MTPVASGFEFPPGCVDPDEEARKAEADYWFQRFTSEIDRASAMAFPAPAIEANEAGFYRDGRRIRFGRPRLQEDPMADKNGPIDPRQEDLAVDPRAKEGDYQFGTVVHLGRQGVEVEWTAAAEAALAEARESFEMEDVEGYPVLGYVDADLDGGMYLVGLLIVAICGAVMGALFVLGIWMLSS